LKKNCDKNDEKINEKNQKIKLKKFKKIVIQKNGKLIRKKNCVFRSPFCPSPFTFPALPNTLPNTQLESTQAVAQVSPNKTV
jgi:hypothetical protein